MTNVSPNWFRVPSLVTALAFAMSASAINLPEGTSKLALANEVNKTYIMPLRLKGKSATHAIGVLIGNQFRCGVEASDLVGLDSRPLARCIKKPSGVGDLCDELIVTMRFDGASVASRVDVLQRLDSLVVGSAVSFCPYPRRVAPEYFTARSVGEENLVPLVRDLNLLGNAGRAFDKLWIAGFYCGFRAEPGTHPPGSKLNLVCTMVPSQIKFCFEAVVEMDLEWPLGADISGQPLEGIRTAEVKAVRSSCQIPLVSNVRAKGGRDN